MKKITTIALMSLLFAGCAHENKTEQASAPKVKIADIQATTTSGELHYSGTAEAFQTIPLSFQSTGTVKQVFVSVGDAVHKGQVLATLDDIDARNMADITRQKYTQAKDAYDRLKTVHASGSLPEVKWVEMETNLQQAQSSLEIAINNLKKCTLTAPESGIIGERNIEPGANPITTLSPLTMVKIDQIYIKISAPENEIVKIKKGQQASIHLSALDNGNFTGTVTNIGVVANQISRTYEVKILVKNPGHEIKPGMVCDVNLGTNASKTVVAVPYSAVFAGSDGCNCVYVVNATEKKVTLRKVKTGNYIDNNIEILEGLKVGERIVTEGQYKLSSNCAIDY